MYRVRSLDGKPWKRYRKGINGEITSDFTPGSRFDLIERIPATTSMEKLADTWIAARTNNQCVIPNLPKDGRTTNFPLTKRGLALAPFELGVLDADSSGVNLLSLPNLHERSQDKLIRAGLPSNIGYIAVWSSSRFLITDNPKEAIHIIFRFKEPLNKEEYSDFLKAIEGDERMSERGRILATMPPTFDDGVPFADYERYSEIYFQEGEALDVRAFMAGRSIPAATSSRDVYRELHNQLDRSHFFEAVKNYYDDKGRKPQWSNIPKLIEISSFLLKRGLMKHRHNIHFQILRLAHRSKTDIQEAISGILDDEVLLGNHSENELLSQAAKVKRDFLEQSRGGAIQRIFRDDEIIEVNRESLEDLTNDEWRKLFIKKGVVVMKSPCGSGKSYYGIKALVDKIDPESLISIAHRVAVGIQNANILGLTYQDDVGLDEPGSPTKRAERKKLFLPGHETVSILVQSIHCLGGNGKIQKRQMVVVDEIETVLEELILDKRAENSRDLYDKKSEQFYNLITLCDEADIVVVASDMASASLTGWFLEQLDGWKKEKRRLLLNHLDYIRTMRFYQLTSEAEAISTAIRLLKDGKRIVIASDSGTNVSEKSVSRLASPIKSILGLSDSQLKTFDAESFRNSAKPNLQSDPYNTIPRLFDEGMKAMVVSPVFDVGWQNARPEEAFTFDAVVVISSYGMAHAHTLIQWFRRYRFTTDVFAYIKNERGIWTREQKQVETQKYDRFGLYEAFLEIGRGVADARKDAPRQHFWDEIEDRGGKLYVSPYELDPGLLREVQGILNEELEKAKSVSAEKLRGSASLVEKVCEIIFQESEIDKGEQQITLEPIRTLQTLTDDEIRSLNESVIKEEDAIALMRAWRGNEYERMALGQQREMMDVSIVAQLLEQVDLSLGGQFPGRLRSLLELTLHNRYKTEIFVNGLPNIEGTKEELGWSDFIDLNKEKIKATGYSHLITRGKGTSLRNFLEDFAKLYGFSFEKVEKKTGISKARKNLITSYKNQKVKVPGKGVIAQGEWLKMKLVTKVKNGENLTPMEKAFYETIGDRVILRRNEIVPMRLYAHLLDVLLGNNSHQDVFEDMNCHKPAAFSSGDSEKNNFYKASF